MTQIITLKTSRTPSQMYDRDTLVPGMVMVHYYWDDVGELYCYNGKIMCPLCKKLCDKFTKYTISCGATHSIQPIFQCTTDNQFENLDRNIMLEPLSIATYEFNINRQLSDCLRAMIVTNDTYAAQLSETQQIIKTYCTCCYCVSIAKLCYKCTRRKKMLEYVYRFLRQHMDDDIAWVICNITAVQLLQS